MIFDLVFSGLLQGNEFSLSRVDSIGLQVGKPPSHWESLRLPISPGMILKPWFTLQVKFQQLRHLLNNLKFLFWNWQKLHQSPVTFWDGLLTTTCSICKFARKFPEVRTSLIPSHEKRLQCEFYASYFIKRLNQASKEFFEAFSISPRLDCFSRKSKTCTDFSFPDVLYCAAFL